MIKKIYIKLNAKIHQEEDLKTAITIKLKNGLEKMRKKNSTNCDKISHYQQVEESWRVLLKITSIMHAMARQKSVKEVLPELWREIIGS